MLLSLNSIEKRLLDVNSYIVKIKIDKSIAKKETFRIKITNKGVTP